MNIFVDICITNDIIRIMERQENFSELVSVRISRDLRDQLEQLAKADLRPLANYIRLVLEQHVTAKKTESEAA